METLPKDSLRDGPHVYWESSSKVIVFYLCADTLAGRTLAVRGTGVFNGFCGDEGTEYMISARAPEVEPDVFDGIPRILAVSDIHGEYEALVSLLVNAGVVDKELKWSWGKGHLVVLGDIFDRGDRVTECLWLVHRLEREAREADGRVHYLLGNHETMVMRGDLRYVHDKYLNGIAKTSGILYQDLFGPAMELGRWLRARPMAIRLNGVLFVHGGIGPGVLERGLDLRTINTRAREGIDLRSYEFVFRDMPGFLFQSEGPLWYRGYHRSNGYPKATEEYVRSVLDRFQASAVVVGHTDIGEIQSLYGGLVFGIDVDVEELAEFQALLWEGGSFFKVLGDGSRSLLRDAGGPGGSGGRERP
jgi:hypothetical protein